jgi:DnaJ homolog subfamily A member 2
MLCYDAVASSGVRGVSSADHHDTPQAYGVLSDPEKREMYDRAGEEGLKEQAGIPAGVDIFDILSGGFGGPFGGGRGGRGGQKSSGRRKGKDVVHPLHVSLEDLYKGKLRKMRITRKVLCTQCDGQGATGTPCASVCACVSARTG